MSHFRVCNGGGGEGGWLVLWFEQRFSPNLHVDDIFVVVLEELIFFGLSL